MQPRVLSSVFVFALVAMTGCARDTPVQSAADADRAGADRDSAPVASASTAAATDHNAQCAVTAVYYEYDSSDLDDRAKAQLEANARCLQQRPQTHARVVGMTDPRGTEEYNLALGDRRARAATQYMNRLGVDGHRLEATSAGEEMASGEDESGWARDRRSDVDVR